MNLVIPLPDGRIEMFGDCERKVAVFCAIDAYLKYDVEGRPDDPNIITMEQIEAMNRAMQARSPHGPWARLVGAPLRELVAIDASCDLIAMSDQEWHSVRLALRDLYNRVILQPHIGPASGTKVLHLMRPRLVAIADSVVIKWLGIPESDPADRALAVAEAIRAIGRTDGNQAALADIQRYLGSLGFVSPVPSACRILDMLLWMKAVSVPNGRRYDYLWQVMELLTP